MNNVTWTLIRLAQQKSLPEYNQVRAGKQIATYSRLKDLNPVIDEQGLLRVDGRLRHVAFLSEDQTCPIILPQDHHVMELIIKDVHERGHHNLGVNHTLAELSTHY